MTFFGRSGSGNRQGLGRSGNKGRNGGSGLGIGGYCLCAKCGEKVAHIRGQNCTTTKCPKCSHVMIREDVTK